MNAKLMQAKQGTAKVTLKSEQKRNSKGSKIRLVHESHTKLEVFGLLIRQPSNNERLTRRGDKRASCAIVLVFVIVLVGGGGVAAAAGAAAVVVVVAVVVWLLQ